ncbi:MAG: hypothetical protein FRX49_02119 [Trebouxia sp. A1-2]|nr:MAG: hypothetical protein FRX49_02119 [Trebouxia sp. A1-2]
MSLITAGAPLKNSRAEPLGPSSDHTTTPDLRVCNVKSITFAMESLASRASENLRPMQDRTDDTVDESFGPPIKLRIDLQLRIAGS